MADPDWLTAEATSGLIALSGGMQGDIGRALLAGHPDVARSERLQRWQSLFGDRFYVEVTRAGRPGEEQCLQESIALAGRAGAPVVATNDVRFIDPDDYEAHEARVCIQQGRTLADSGPAAALQRTAVPEVAGRNGVAVRGYSRGHRQYRGDRPSL